MMSRSLKLGLLLLVAVQVVSAQAPAPDFDEYAERIEDTFAHEIVPGPELKTKVQAVAWRNIDNIAPAGSINFQSSRASQIP